MPLQPGGTMPKENLPPPLPNDTYEVEFADIDEVTMKSKYPKPDGTPGDDYTQYQMKFLVKEDGQYFDKPIFCRLGATLRVPKKNTTGKIYLPEFLLAVTGKVFSLQDQVNNDFLMSFLGAKLRVGTKIAVTDAGEFVNVISFSPTKRT